MSDESNNPELGFDAATDAIKKLYAPTTDKPELIAEDEQQAEPEIDPALLEQDAETDDETPPTQRYRVKVDGEELEVTEAELLSGYQRDADYRRKTQEVAEHRKQVEAEKAAIEQVKHQYVLGLHALQQQMQAQLPPRPTEQDFDDDPIGAVKAERAFQAHLERLRAVQGEQQRMTAQQEAEQEQHFVQVLMQEEQKLLQLVPEWKDEKLATAEKAKVREFLESAGYSRDEIVQALDARAVAISRDAMRYRNIIKKQAELQSQPVKTVAPGASRQPRVTSEVAKSFNRLQTSGRPDDAAALIKQLNLRK